MSLSQQSWNARAGEDLNRQLQALSPGGIPQALGQMNKSSMNFNNRAAPYFGRGQDGVGDRLGPGVREEDQADGSNTMKASALAGALDGRKPLNISRFGKREATEADADSAFYDPDHQVDPDRDLTTQDEQDHFLKDTFGQASFEDRSDVSQSNATNKYYQSHMRRFYEHHNETKGLGEIQPVAAGTPAGFRGQIN